MRRRKLPPPAASTVYELTEYGEELRPVMHVLAHWGARSLPAPTGDEELEEGWLAAALQVALPPSATDARIEFRVDGEVASFAGGESHAGSIEDPDATVESDRAGFFHLLVDRDLEKVEVRGNEQAVLDLLGTLPYAADPAARRDGLSGSSRRRAPKCRGVVADASREAAGEVVW